MMGTPPRRSRSAGGISDDAAKSATGKKRQMITVAYEQERGLREVHEKPGGYEIGRSKTVPVGVAHVFEAWSDPVVRRVWLADPDFTVRKSTPERSMRITWIDGSTHVDVYFWPKGDAKTRVSVQHKKLGDPRAAERAKAYWSRQLLQLGELFTA